MKTVFLTEWRARLSDPTGISKYSKISEPWTTCATGDRVFQELGRRSKNYTSSLIPAVKKMGVAFHEAVKDGNRDEAIKLLEQIENLETLWKFEVKEIDSDKPCPHCNNNAKLIMEERVCRFGHPIHVSRCSKGHSESK